MVGVNNRCIYCSASCRQSMRWCCDEMDRTQSGLPLKKGRAVTMTHGDKRHGTTTLFAALEHLGWAGHRPF